MHRIPFDWFEFAFECFESLSKGLNLHSNASNPFRMVQICIRMLRIMTMQYSCYIQQSDAPRNKSSNPMNILHISEDGSAGIMEIAKYKNSAYCGRQTIDISNVDHLLSHLVDYVEKDRPVLFQRKERPSLLIHGKYTSKLN